MRRTAVAAAAADRLREDAVRIGVGRLHAAGGLHLHLAAVAVRAARAAEAAAHVDVEEAAHALGERHGGSGRAGLLVEFGHLLEMPDHLLVLADLRLDFEQRADDVHVPRLARRQAEHALREELGDLTHAALARVARSAAACAAAAADRLRVNRRRVRAGGEDSPAVRHGDLAAAPRSAAAAAHTDVEIEGAAGGAAAHCRAAPGDAAAAADRLRQDALGVGAHGDDLPARSVDPANTVRDIDRAAVATGRPVAAHRDVDAHGGYIAARGEVEVARARAAAEAAAAADGLGDNRGGILAVGLDRAGEIGQRDRAAAPGRTAAAAHGGGDRQRRRADRQTQDVGIAAGAAAAAHAHQVHARSGGAVGEDGAGVFRIDIARVTAGASLSAHSHARGDRGVERGGRQEVDRPRDGRAAIATAPAERLREHAEGRGALCQHLPGVPDIDVAGIATRSAGPAYRRDRLDQGAGLQRVGGAAIAAAAADRLRLKAVGELAIGLEQTPVAQDHQIAPAPGAAHPAHGHRRADDAANGVGIAAHTAPAADRLRQHAHCAVAVGLDAAAVGQRGIAVIGVLDAVEDLRQAPVTAIAADPAQRDRLEQPDRARAAAVATAAAERLRHHAGRVVTVRRYAPGRSGQGYRAAATARIAAATGAHEKATAVATIAAVSADRLAEQSDPEGAAHLDGAVGG